MLANFFFLFCIFWQVNALKCYSCQWSAGTGPLECVQEPPPPKYLRECSHPQCWKKHTALGNGTVVSVQRFCVDVAREPTCRENEVTSKLTGEVTRSRECVCNLEACNYAPLMIISYWSYFTIFLGLSINFYLL